MRAIVVFESMYGATHAVADAVAEGLAPHADVVVVHVADAADVDVDGADLLVVGGPTHMHGMASTRSREMAVHAAEKNPALHVEPAATAAPGMREWLEARSGTGRRAAAFDTRLDKPALLTGAAGHAIGKRLRHHGYRLVAEPASFRVDDKGALLAGESVRARAWGAALARAGGA